MLSKASKTKITKCKNENYNTVKSEKLRKFVGMKGPCFSLRKLQSYEVLYEDIYEEFFLISDWGFI